MWEVSSSFVGFFKINIIRKKRLEEFHIFIIFFAFTEIRNNLPKKFLPNTDRNANHYATEHL